MANDSAFDVLCDQLERDCSLDRLEARGTVRIAIKEAGLDPHSASPQELAVVVKKVLPGELTARGVDDAASLCDRLAKLVSECKPESARETPEAIFARLGSR